VKVNDKEYKKYGKEPTKRKIIIAFALSLILFILIIFSVTEMPLMHSESGWYIPYTNSGSIVYVSDNTMYFIENYTVFQDIYTKYDPFVVEKYKIRFASTPVVTINGTPRNVYVDYFSHDAVKFKAKSFVTEYKIDGQVFTPNGRGIVLFNVRALIILIIVLLIGTLYSYELTKNDEIPQIEQAIVFSIEIGILVSLIYFIGIPFSL